MYNYYYDLHHKKMETYNYMSDKYYISNTAFWMSAKDYSPSYELSVNLLDVRVYVSISNGHMITMLHSKPFGIGHEFFELAGYGIGDGDEPYERFDSLEDAENRIKEVIT